jgi:hypothetical protein
VAVPYLDEDAQLLYLEERYSVCSVPTPLSCPGSLRYATVNVTKTMRICMISTLSKFRLDGSDYVTHDNDRCGYLQTRSMNREDAELCSNPTKRNRKRNTQDM